MNIDFTQYECELLWKLLDATALAQDSPTDQGRFMRLRNKFSFANPTGFKYDARNTAINDWFASNPSPSEDQLRDFAKSLKGSIYSNTTFVGDIVRTIKRVRGLNKKVDEGERG